MRLARPVVALCALLAIAGSALAQDRSGSITGTVRDSSGGILPGASVTATSPSLVGVQTAVSDGQGTYRFPALTPGVYEITVELQGFTTQKTPNFDQDFVTRWHTVPYRDTFNVPNATFFSGTFDPVATQAAAPATFRPDARFGLPDQYQTRREMRLQVKFTF